MLNCGSFGNSDHRHQGIMIHLCFLGFKKWNTSSKFETIYIYILNNWIMLGNNLIHYKPSNRWQMLLKFSTTESYRIRCRWHTAGRGDNGTTANYAWNNHNETDIKCRDARAFQKFIVFPAFILCTLKNVNTTDLLISSLLKDILDKKEGNFIFFVLKIMYTIGLHPSSVAIENRPISGQVT